MVTQWAQRRLSEMRRGDKRRGVGCLNWIPLHCAKRHTSMSYLSHRHSHKTGTELMSVADFQRKFKLLPVWSGRKKHTDSFAAWLFSICFIWEVFGRFSFICFSWKGHCVPRNSCVTVQSNEHASLLFPPFLCLSGQQALNCNVYFSVFMYNGIFFFLFMWEILKTTLILLTLMSFVKNEVPRCPLLLQAYGGYSKMFWGKTILTNQIVFFYCFRSHSVLFNDLIQQY